MTEQPKKIVHNLDNIAFCFLAVGNVAYKHHLEYAVNSLRTIGGWKGDVYILSDQPSCYPNIQGEHTRIINVNDPKVSMDSYVSNPRLKRTKIRMTKTIMLDMLPKNIEYVVYLDTDILTTKKNCVFDFLKDNEVLKGWPNERVLSIKWWEDDDGRNKFDQGKFNLHTGSFIFARNHTEKLMHKWGELFKDSDIYDRTSLKQATQELYFPNIYYNKDMKKWKYKDEDKILPSLESHIGKHLFHIVQGDTMLKENQDTDEISACFTHITSNRCTLYDPKYVDNFVESFIEQYYHDFCPEKSTFQGKFEEIFFRFGISFSSCEKKQSADLKYKTISETPKNYTDQLFQPELYMVELFCIITLVLLAYFLCFRRRN